MKKFILPLFLAAITLASCSNDDTTTNPPLNGLTLAKTIEYFPLQSNFNQREVSYYQNNQLVADTLFNSAGAVLSRTAVTVNGNTKTSTYYNAANTITGGNVYTYDGNGRLTHHERLDGTYPVSYTYNQDNTITYSYWNQDTQALEPYVTFYKNNEGLITSLSFPDNEEGYIGFNGTTPSQLITVTPTGAEQVFVNFTFFNVEVPATMQKSITERNNSIIQQYQLNQLADTHSLYIKSYEGLWEYERQFDTDNYVTYTKTINLQASNTSETFYYYQ